ELARAARLPTEELVERAAEAAWRAGERARQFYANAEAAEYFRPALELLDEATWADTEWRTELLAAANESLGDVLELTRDYDEGLAAFVRAAALVPRQDRVRRARLLRKQGWNLKLRSRYEESIACFDAG